MKPVYTTIALVALLLGLPAQSSATSIDFTFDTSSLVGGIFDLDLVLIDGDVTNNTTITVDLFDFGGGSLPLGGPALSGGANGSLASTVTLTDSDFFNTFTQSFMPGSVLKFRLDVDSTATGGLQPPDGFQFSILDGSGFPIATTDPSGLNTLLLGDFPGGISSFQLQSPVPEPDTLLLVGTGIVALATLARRFLS